MKSFFVILFILWIPLCLMGQRVGGEIQRPTSSISTISTQINKIPNTEGNTHQSTKKYTVEEIYGIGLDYYNNSNYKEAYKWFEEAADQGHSFSKYVLGLMYKKGLGRSKDIEVAKRYFDAIDYEFYTAARNMMNSDGEYAIQLFNAVAEMDVTPYSAFSLFHIGEIYYFSKGGIKFDFSKAFTYFSLAAQRGNNPSLYFMGLCYEYGRGVQKNMTKAKEYYEKSGYEKVPSTDF